MAQPISRKQRAGADVGIWAIPNPRAAVNLCRVAQACVDAGLRTVVFWSEHPGRGGGRPENYPVNGLEFSRVDLRTSVGRLRYPHPAAIPFLLPGVRHALEQVRLRCLITQLDHSGADRVFHYVAKRAGIPGLVMQEGMANVPKDLLAGLSKTQLRRWTWIRPRGYKAWFGKIPHSLFRTVAPYMFADYVCVWGDVMKRHLRRLGREEDEVFVTGSPAFDDVTSIVPLKPAQPATILYAQQPMSLPLGARQPFYEQLIQTVAQDLRCRLLFKLHPSSAGEAGMVEELVRRTPGASPLVEVFGSGDSVDLLERASVLVAASSTTCYHAAISGLPLVLINYLSKDIHFDIGGSGGAAVVNRPDELTSTLRRAISDETFRERLYAGSKILLNDHLHLLDGRAAQRVAAVAKGLSQRS